MQKLISAILIALTSTIIALLATIVYQNTTRDGSPNIKSAYHAVLLTNGQVFFGHLENLGNPYPVLRDVFYFQSRFNPDTKQTTNTLVRRGKELHGPEIMVLNANVIAFIEPVSDNSQVAKGIAEQKNLPR